MGRPRPAHRRPVLPASILKSDADGRLARRPAAAVRRRRPAPGPRGGRDRGHSRRTSWPASDGGTKPEVRILGRDGDETSKLAWPASESSSSGGASASKEVRFARRGLPADFDQPVAIIDPDDAKPAETRTADELRDVLVKFLPFLLVMWTMAGALHPAIDLTAGEKERGTMETLLICPAGRTEIVAGKFLAVFVVQLRVGAVEPALDGGRGALARGTAAVADPVVRRARLGGAAGRPARRPLQLSRPRPRSVRPVDQGGAILSVAAHAADPAAEHVRPDARLEADAAPERRSRCPA